MNRTLNNVLIFATGAAIGSLVTWYYVKTKYERIAQEEIDSVKAEFTTPKYEGPQNAEEDEPIDITEVEEPIAEDAMEGRELVQKLGYYNYSDVEPGAVTKKKVDISEEDPDGPKIIEPEEFGELGYKVVELNYWADGVLTDKNNKRIQDVDGLIGKGNIDQFGKYEEDALHVRDHEKKIDFEILRDLKRYSDFFDVSPHGAEDE